MHVWTITEYIELALNMISSNKNNILKLIKRIQNESTQYNGIRISFETEI